MFHTESDVVFVKGLKVEAVIGVYAWERAIKQPILIDIALETDISKAAVSDDVKDALNYKAVCDDISAWCIEIKAELLEHLAGQLADRLLAAYACQKVTLSVAKPTAIAQADAVGVQITRYASVSKTLKNESADTVKPSHSSDNDHVTHDLTDDATNDEDTDVAHQNDSNADTQTVAVISKEESVDSSDIHESSNNPTPIISHPSDDASECTD